MNRSVKALFCGGPKEGLQLDLPSASPHYNFPARSEPVDFAREVTTPADVIGPGPGIDVYELQLVLPAGFDDRQQPLAFYVMCAGLRQLPPYRVAMALEQRLAEQAILTRVHLRHNARHPRYMLVRMLDIAREVCAAADGHGQRCGDYLQAFVQMADVLEMLGNSSNPLSYACPCHRDAAAHAFRAANALREYVDREDRRGRVLDPENLRLLDEAQRETARRVGALAGIPLDPQAVEELKGKP